MTGSCVKREKEFLFPTTMFTQKLRKFTCNNWGFVTSKKTIYLAISYFQITDPSPNMNQGQASGNNLIKKTEVLQDVIDILELWFNKDEEAREVKKYITIVETYSGVGTNKIIV